MHLTRFTRHDFQRIVICRTREIFGRLRRINRSLKTLCHELGNPTDMAVKFGLLYNSTAAIQLQQILFDGQVFVGLQARKTSLDFQAKNV